MSSPRAEERAHSGPLLHALYPLGGTVPLLRRLPVGLRRRTRRLLTAAAVRAHMARCRETAVIAITGSVGKTTTKDLLAAMLAPAGSTVKTRKNDNGLYGVPATLLSMRPEDRFAVVEAGIFSTPGEMGWMASLFEPEVAILTSLSGDHSSYYGSIEAVAGEKRALLERVGADGAIVVNADDDLVRRTAEGLEARVLTAGRADDADFRVVSAEAAWPEGMRIEIAAGGSSTAATIRLFGTHLAPAVAMAAAAASAVGVEPRQALAALGDFEPPEARLQPAPGPRGATWLLDDFKSRESNQAASLRALGEISGPRRVAVIGRVQEGSVEDGWRRAAELLPGRAEVVIAVGERSEMLADLLDGAPAPSAVEAHERFEEAATALERIVEPGDVILLHGGTRDHLRRIKIQIERGSVGCRVRRCSLHWLCEDCPHLDSGPPDLVVLER